MAQTRPNKTIPSLLQAILSLLILATPFSHSLADESLTDRAKAALIYRCVEGMIWPESRMADGRWVIGIVGDDGIRSVLTKDLAGKTIKGRSFTVIDPSFDLRNCHVVFISQSAKRSPQSVITQARENSVLTIGESDDGFMIRIHIENNSVRPIVDMGRLKQSGIKASAALLAVLPTK